MYDIWHSFKYKRINSCRCCLRSDKIVVQVWSVMGWIDSDNPELQKPARQALRKAKAL